MKYLYCGNTDVNRARYCCISILRSLLHSVSVFRILSKESVNKSMTVQLRFIGNISLSHSCQFIFGGLLTAVSCRVYRKASGEMEEYGGLEATSNPPLLDPQNQEEEEKMN